MGFPPPPFGHLLQRRTTVLPVGDVRRTEGDNRYKIACRYNKIIRRQTSDIFLKY